MSQVFYTLLLLYYYCSKKSTRTENYYIENHDALSLFISKIILRKSSYEVTSNNVELVRGQWGSHIAVVVLDNFKVDSLRYNPSLYIYTYSRHSFGLTRSLVMTFSHVKVIKYAEHRLHLDDDHLNQWLPQIIIDWSMTSSYANSIIYC